MNQRIGIFTMIIKQSLYFIIYCFIYSSIIIKQSYISSSIVLYTALYISIIYCFIYTIIKQSCISSSTVLYIALS